MIWHTKPTVKDLNDFCKNSLVDHMSIEIVEIGENFISAKMPILDQTKQPHGIMHGGASCVLAETVASLASNLCLDQNEYRAVGSSIETKHIRPVKSGIVIGITKPIHLGRRNHIWEIQITDEFSKLVSTSQLTTAIVHNK